jgi:hypothetical protein
MTNPERQQAARTIDAYLARVADGLPGPRRARAAILAELRAGLLDATGAHRQAGLTPSAAARAATGEFGNPMQLAASFGAELTTARARRLALVLLASAPLIALAWIGAAVGSHLGARHALPWQWRSASPDWRLALPVAAVALVVGACAAAAAVAATGRITRWCPDCARFAPTSAIAAAIAAATVDLILLLLLTRQLARARRRRSTRPPSRSPPLRASRDSSSPAKPSDGLERSSPEDLAGGRGLCR